MKLDCENNQQEYVCNQRENVEVQQTLAANKYMYIFLSITCLCFHFNIFYDFMTIITSKGHFSWPL